MVKKNTIEIQKAYQGEGSKLQKYQDLILGRRSLWKLFQYEFITGLYGSMPGALGLVLRMKLYPKLLGGVGRNVTFGGDVVLRHPHKIHIGSDVVIDDHVVLDAKGEDNQGITIGDGAFIGRNTILNCKNGDIILGERVNMGFNCHIFSASSVQVERDNLIAAYCYLVGGTHKTDDPDIPVLDQERESHGVRIGAGGWLGAHVTVFDGVEIGKHCIIAAGSVVNKPIPDYSVAGGVPAKVIRNRKKET